MRRDLRHPFLALLLLLVGGELFFRFAGYGSLKALAIALVLGGIVVLGSWQWGPKQIIYRGVVWALFAGYLAQATWRFEGLTKEPIPSYQHNVEAAKFGIKGLLALIVLTFCAAGVAHGLRAVGRRLFGGPSSV